MFKLLYTINTVVSVAFDERTGVGFKVEVLRYPPLWNKIPGLPLKPLVEYAGLVPVPPTVVFHPFPDLSFHPFTVTPLLSITVLLSYASNHIASCGIVEGRIRPDIFVFANVIVLLSVASYHMIGPDERGPV